MKEYTHLFAGQDEDEQIQANDFSSKVMDICEYLDQIGFIPPETSDSTEINVAYHDACHLAHAQKIRSAPRSLLKSVTGITLLEPAEWEICCGSAGSYNIEHPDTAKELGKRKVANLYDTGADIIATGNIGCLAQIEFHSKDKKSPIRVVHTVELLDGMNGEEVQALTKDYSPNTASSPARITDASGVRPVQYSIPITP